MKYNIEARSWYNIQIFYHLTRFDVSSLCRALRACSLTSERSWTIPFSTCRTCSCRLKKKKGRDTKLPSNFNRWHWMACLWDFNLCIFNLLLLKLKMSLFLNMLSAQSHAFKSKKRWQGRWFVLITFSEPLSDPLTQCWHW